MGYGETEARGLKERVCKSPNSFNTALVYMANFLFPSRWTHEDWLEVVADTTENCGWVGKEARQLGRVDLEAPGAQVTPLVLPSYSSKAWLPSAFCSSGPM